jgi:hypothetical protein
MLIIGKSNPCLTSTMSASCSASPIFFIKKRKEKIVQGQWHLLAPSGILQFETFLELHVEQLPSETGSTVFLQGGLKNN